MLQEQCEMSESDKSPFWAEAASILSEITALDRNRRQDARPAPEALRIVGFLGEPAAPDAH